MLLYFVSNCVFGGATTLSLTTFSLMTLSITINSVTVRIMAEHCYAECCLCWVSLKLRVTYAACHLYTYAECHLCWVSLMLSVTYAECHLCWVWLMLSVTYAECHLCWCHLCCVSLLSILFWVSLSWMSFAECRGAFLVNLLIPFRKCLEGFHVL